MFAITILYQGNLTAVLDMLSNSRPDSFICTFLFIILGGVASVIKVSKKVLILYCKRTSRRPFPYSLLLRTYLMTQYILRRDATATCNEQQNSPGPAETQGRVAGRA